MICKNCGREIYIPTPEGSDGYTDRCAHCGLRDDPPDWTFKPCQDCDLPFWAPWPDVTTCHACRALVKVKPVPCPFCRAYECSH